MKGLDRVVVVALGLAAVSAGLAMHAAWPALHYLRANAEQRQVQQLLERIAENADRLGRSLDLETAADRSLDEIRQAVNDLGQAAARLRDRSRDRPSDALDVQEMLRCRGSIDAFTRHHQFGDDERGLWLSLRDNVDRLDLAWTWADAPAGRPRPIKSPVTQPVRGTPRD